jgi:hypothetical protein
MDEAGFLITGGGEQLFVLGALPGAGGDIEVVAVPLAGRQVLIEWCLLHGRLSCVVRVLR